jgi:ApaG protein
VAELSKYQEIPGLTVSVDKVEYLPGSDNPPHRPYRFGYYICIRNDSVRVVTILSRKWIVTNAKGHKLMIEGDGVMGQFPHLTPGDLFQYNNYHLIDSESSAEGVYLGKDEDGENIMVRIPSFQMKIPSTSS